MREPEPAGAQVGLALVESSAIKDEPLTATGVRNTEEPTFQKGPSVRVPRQQRFRHQDAHAAVQHVANEFFLTVGRNTVAAAYTNPEISSSGRMAVLRSATTRALSGHMNSSARSSPARTGNATRDKSTSSEMSTLGLPPRGQRWPVLLHAMCRLCDGVCQPRSASPSGK